MTLSYFPPLLTSVFSALGHWLDKRTARRLPALLARVLFARGCRTVTSWFRAGGITDDFRQSYVAVCAIGRESEHLALTVVTDVVRPLLKGKRLRIGIDDTPTQRYGPCVEGAGIHHHPTPGPAHQRHLYGHAWVTSAWVVRHPLWHTLTLPLLADLYVRATAIAPIDADHRPPSASRVRS